MEAPRTKVFNTESIDEEITSVYDDDTDDNSGETYGPCVRIKRLTETAQLPTKGSPVAAGYDFYADIPSSVTIEPHKTVKIGTGLAIAVPDCYWLGLFARSGLAAKEGLRPANCVGVVDPDYRGEVIAAIHNDSDEVRQIFPGDRIGQLILMERFDWDMQEVEELDDTERGAGGFGSTGMQ